MSVERTFETFCAMSALQQRHGAAPAPAASARDFSFYQWLTVAKSKYEEAQSSTPHAHQEREHSTPSKRLKRERSAGGAPNALSEALAQQLTASLVKLNTTHNAPAPLRHAAQEAFPLPEAAADLPAFLAVAEAAIRFTLWVPEDTRLAQLAALLRPNLRSLEEDAVIGCRTGCYPSLQVLMDLFSWRIISHRWDRLSLEMRQVAIDGVVTLCSYVESAAAEELSVAMQALQGSVASTPVIAVPLVTLDALVGRVSASIPFEFSSCRDLISLYPEPSGVLRIPSTQTPLPASTAANAQREPQTKQRSLDDDMDVRIGELLDTDITMAQSSVTSQEEEEATTPRTTSTSRPQPHTASTEVPPRKIAVLSNGNMTAGRKRPFAQEVKKYPACVSRYHARYAETSKHASAECPFCATCHVMEIVFRGNERRCTWNHWPTKRKIIFHLKAFPKVMKLAEARFEAMTRGVKLAATDEVPL